MAKALIFLVTGFEEIEALTIVDVLRRGNVSIDIVSLEEEKTVVGAHSVPVVSDFLFSEIQEFSDVDLFILPGGTVRINEHEGLKKIIIQAYENHQKIGAICAAPMVLGGLGLLKGKNVTCYPGFEQYLEGAILQTDEAVVVDGHLVTGKGPAFSIEFSLILLEFVTDKQNREEVAKGLLLL